MTWHFSASVSNSGRHLFFSAIDGYRLWVKNMVKKLQTIDEDHDKSINYGCQSCQSWFFSWGSVKTCENPGTLLFTIFTPIAGNSWMFLKKIQLHRFVSSPDGFHPHFIYQGAQLQVLGVGCQQGRQEGGISNGNEVAIAIKSWCHERRPVFRTHITYGVQQIIHDFCV